MSRKDLLLYFLGCFSECQLSAATFFNDLLSIIYSNTHVYCLYLALSDYTPDIWAHIFQLPWRNWCQCFSPSLQFSFTDSQNFLFETVVALQNYLLAYWSQPCVKILIKPRWFQSPPQPTRLVLAIPSRRCHLLLEYFWSVFNIKG